jgi:hypothetical protein
MEETAARRVARWPLFLIAAPAAAAVWSGWVGLGQLSGFGIIHPLPGIWDSARLNTAITLPIGVEAYGAYALGAWLTPGTSERARRFARSSAIGSLGLGMAGQVIYHLLAAAHATRAPWPVVTLVSCLPVVALAFGAALAHLLHAEPDESDAPETAQEDHAIETVADSPTPASEPASAPQPVSVPAPRGEADSPPDEPEVAAGERGALRKRAQVTPQDAEIAFASMLSECRVPSLRHIRRELPVGQPKARMLRAHLESVAMERQSRTHSSSVHVG